MFITPSESNELREMILRVFVLAKENKLTGVLCVSFAPLVASSIVISGYGVALPLMIH